MKVKDAILICSTIVLTLVFVWVFTPEDRPPSSYYRDEFRNEINKLREEIREDILKDLIIRYEAVDTIITNDGVNNHIDDFRERTGQRLPPRRFGHD